MTLRTENGSWSLTVKIIAAIVATFLSTATLFFMIITPILSGTQKEIVRLKSDMVEIKQDIRDIKVQVQVQQTDIAVIKNRLLGNED